MTGSDLIVVAPWIVFAVALTIVWFLLRRSARASRRGPGRLVPLPARPTGSPGGPASGRTGRITVAARAKHNTRHDDPAAHAARGHQDRGHGRTGPLPQARRPGVKARQVLVSGAQPHDVHRRLSNASRLDRGGCSQRARGHLMAGFTPRSRLSRRVPGVPARGSRSLAIGGRQGPGSSRCRPAAGLLAAMACRPR